MKIILWKLGSLEYKIYPSIAAIKNFQQILANSLEEGSGDLNIIWGPDIEVQKVDIDNIEEIEKYGHFIVSEAGCVHVIERVVDNEKIDYACVDGTVTRVE